MQTYEFSLTFSLSGVDDPKRVVQHLYHTTCHDALICIIDEEHIEVCFEREAPSLSLAQEHAISDVVDSVSYASFIGAGTMRKHA